MKFPVILISVFLLLAPDATTGKRNPGGIIAILNAKIEALEARINLLEGGLEAEADARIAGDAFEANARKADIAAEATIRHADIDAETTAREAASAIETAAREAGDAAEAALRQAGDATEAAARTAVDAALQTMLGDEANARASGDSALQMKIDKLAGDFASGDVSLQMKIDNETTAREEGDIALQKNINNEATSRAAADTALQANISNEAIARAAEDDTLHTKIDNEAIARIEADATLQASISAEADTRSAEDGALHTKIDNGITTLASEDALLQGIIASSIAEIRAELNLLDASSVNAAITQQIVPTDIQDPILVELVTLVPYPIKLANPIVSAIPDGFRDVVLAETGSCDGTSLTCKQRWALSYVADTGGCELDGFYTYEFHVACSDLSGEDCATIDPSFTVHSITFSLDSENFCDSVVVDARSVVSAITRQEVPNLVTDPILVELVTVSEYPIKLSLDEEQAIPGMISIPPGFNDVTLKESVTCSGPAGEACKQRWELSYVAETACQLDGEYVYRFVVNCISTGSDCDIIDDSGFEYHEVEFTLDSENFCTGI